MKKVLAALVLCLAATSCKGAVSPSTARAEARAAVDVAKDAWILVAHGCVDASEQQKKPAILAACAKVLSPAHDLILDAALAVDLDWSAKSACDLVKATRLISNAVTTLGPIAAEVAPVVADASFIVQKLSGVVCAPGNGG